VARPVSAPTSELNAQDLWVKARSVREKKKKRKKNENNEEIIFGGRFCKINMPRRSDMWAHQVRNLVNTSKSNN
jgi:hypothetical protein